MSEGGTPTTPPAQDAQRDQETPTAGARTPLEAQPAKVTEGDQVAAGLPAVYQTARFAVGEMGVGARGEGAAEGEQEGRLRLPELRVAESR